MSREFKKFNDIDKDLNQVDKYNFNQTAKGYLIQACKIADLSEQEATKMLNSMDRALDNLTAEQAREVYNDSIK